MALQTDASKFVQQELSSRWSLRFSGLTGPCRYIGGGYICGEPTIPGSDYSQHSWGNAMDIYPGVEGLPDDDVKAILDGVHEWLEANKDALGIRVLLWQVEAHYNHIHADFWPKGTLTPACCSGYYTNRWEYSDGRVEVLSPTVSPEMESEGVISDPNELPLYRGDSSALVQHYQERMILWVPEALPLYGADGDFGAETEDWVKWFQYELGYLQTGVIDQKLADFLDSDPPPEPDPDPPDPDPDPPDPDVPPIDPPPPSPPLDVGMEASYRKFFYPRKGKG